MGDDVELRRSGGRATFEWTSGKPSIRRRRVDSHATFTER